VAWRHSGHLGFDRAWYMDRGLVWLVRTIDLHVLQAIPAGTGLRVDTEITAHGRITARRRAAAWLPGAREPAAVAVTDWVLIDARGRPTRLPAEFTTLFGPPTPDADPGRVAIGSPPEAPSSLAIEVRRPDLDPNGHVNNAVHLDWLDEAVRRAEVARARRAPPTDRLPTVESLPRRYRVEYLAPAALDEPILLTSWPGRGGWFVSITQAADSRQIARGSLEAGP
jgi:acyl-CoA thioesterase FadM